MSREILELPAPGADARLSYGPDPFHFGDLRLPAGPGPHPAVVVIHGGFWRARYGLEYFGHACAALATQGFATWNVEYRRIGNPGGGWPGTFQDVALATGYLREIGPTHNLDLERVVTLGHSAGGHLAFWLAGRHPIPPGDPLHGGEPLPLRGAISLAGVVDLRRAWHLRLSEDVVQEFIGGTPDQLPERYASASPIELLPLGVPQILIHGTEDESVPFEISQGYNEVAVARGDDASLVTLEGAGHFEVVDPRSREWASIVDAVRRLEE